MQRLPILNKSHDTGLVYVVERDGIYKIGFTRKGLARRIHDSGGELVIALSAGQRPSVLEYKLNNRFSAKRLPPQGTNPGDKREWFALDSEDLDWLRGLAQYLAVDKSQQNHKRLRPKPVIRPKSSARATSQPLQVVSPRIDDLFELSSNR